ncbi:MAG TPA: Uma2 family endonuclease [Blastocatellia bacterium]|nr:Uma2 family endonuclease [Blastocatellia bacterium]
MATQSTKRYTIEEYIELDKNSEEKFEYFDGEVFNMSGVHPNHALLESRLITTFNNQTAGRGCYVYPANLRVKVPSLPPYRYPDLSALCGKPEFEEHSGLLCLTNPVLLADILSPTTEAFDRGEKFTHYKSITSFREYLLIAQSKKYITHYVRQTERAWLQKEYGAGEVLQIESLDCELDVDALYSGINFESETGF